MDIDAITGFFVGLFIGLFSSAAVLDYMLDSKLSIAKHATTIINECQTSLPRDMTCELTARVLK